MPQPADDGFNNVYPLPLANQSHHELPVALEEITDAVQSFGYLERCAAKLHPGPLRIAGQIGTMERPIVSLQLQLPAIQQSLDMLETFGVANCPDTRWVIRLADARTAAVVRLRAVRRSLRNFLPGMGSLDLQLVADIRELADALYVLRQLIVQQWPATLCGHEKNKGHRDIRR
jgi:hypothetical protein